MNTFSEFAKQVMLHGIEQESIPVSRPSDEAGIRNIFSVPEKPEQYKLHFEKPVGEIAVLVTGGLDSSALYYMAQKQKGKVSAFYIDIGQPYRQKEIVALEKMGVKFKYVNSGIKLDETKFWKHIIPARNFYFLMLVAEKLEQGGEVWFGATDGEMPLSGGDKSIKFINYSNGMLSRLPYKVSLRTPFSEMTKTDIVAWWKENVPLEKLDLTVSCFDEQSGHCGKCQACLRKALAYAANGLTLKTNTDVRVGCKQYIEKYQKLFPKALREKDFSHYSQRRCEQDLKAIDVLLGQS